MHPPGYLPALLALLEAFLKGHPTPRVKTACQVGLLTSRSKTQAPNLGQTAPYWAGGSTRKSFSLFTGASRLTASFSVMTTSEELLPLCWLMCAHVCAHWPMCVHAYTRGLANVCILTHVCWLMYTHVI